LEEIGERRAADGIRDLIREAEQAALVAHEAIAAGQIAPAPADPDKCRWCDYRDICRIESATSVRRAGG
jgi:CRISPR/Cas system-associated exonuclease Cas4 (RecB family)